MTTEYCTAEHENTAAGCYSYPNHPGKHWAVAGDVVDSAHDDGTWVDGKWHWGGDTPVPAEPFTDAELGILLAAIQPVKHFFPDLEAKITKAREALK